MISVDIHGFERETHCTYRGEEYFVRDNGAVLRRGRAGKRKRPLDDKWTFGNPCSHSGYMMVSAHRAHQIVATAFHGPQPTKSHVVDHIDTNRRNNRPENLRWVTRLENILLNPVTAGRIESLYGSVDDFLTDPSSPRFGTLSEDFGWMRTVTKEEADYTRNRLLTWARSGQSMGVRAVRDRVYRGPDDGESLVESRTPGALQRKWRTPAAFPLTPQVAEQETLEAYLKRLRAGSVYAETPFGRQTVVSASMAPDSSGLFILGVFEAGADTVKPWTLTKVTHEDGAFVHESRGTFFTSNGAGKQFAVFQGMLWEGGDSIDDYC
jgi:hypothetical protein